MLPVAALENLALGKELLGTVGVHGLDLEDPVGVLEGAILSVYAEKLLVRVDEELWLGTVTSEREMDSAKGSLVD
jgi:energy-converting hydrogenase Eha subunit A